MQAYSDRRMTMKSAKFCPPLRGCAGEARWSASQRLSGAASPASALLLASKLPRAMTALSPNQGRL